MVGRKKKDAGQDATDVAGETPVRDAPKIELDGPMPPTYLGTAILGVLLCTPLGLLGVYWGLRVRSRWARGDEDGAFSASDKAEMFTYAALGAFMIIAAIALVWAIVQRITESS
jgi:hypothetical protein